jgi:hypothetical protein
MFTKTCLFQNSRFLCDAAHVKDLILLPTSTILCIQLATRKMTHPRCCQMVGCVCGVGEVARIPIGPLYDSELKAESPAPISVACSSSLLHFLATSRPSGSSNLLASILNLAAPVMHTFATMVASVHWSVSPPSLLHMYLG